MKMVKDIEKECRVSDSNELHLITLDERALSFIKGELKHGNLLAKFLNEVKSFDEGQVTAYLPASLGFEKIPDFNHSIFLETGLQFGKIAEQKVIDFVAEYLQKDKSHCFVVETYYHYPKDEMFLQKNAMPHFVFENQVYFFLKESSFNLHEVLHSARDYPFISCLTSLPEQSLMPANSEFIQGLSERTQIIIVKAFDAEGYYLVLEKKQ
jgi:hypothetical protein